MKFRALKTIKLKISKGEIELHPEQVVALKNDVAVMLFNQGKITPVGKASYRIYSKILEDYLWVVATERGLQELVDECVKDAIYTQEEVSNLIGEGISKEGLVAIHKVKNAFPGSSIKDISKKS
ncbi:2-hydroxychromene-2-carboxylate isomerase [Candidatus Scalindua japonica]|uniref:2-hydroxychromene-2-carboxylate isomerase n=1 Tax=Candidatus Scalindua japonica TaxID=1284222 RepID=A0A286TVJ6_9BACT|nr:hypothetical protein [Candidatus Scalindua japonica]GAX59893.1 2-hydroxychromene-2-carboxylate isomerase [Candidatus Scalindua japonica]